jgi:hypothetical protein
MEPELFTHPIKVNKLFIERDLRTIIFRVSTSLTCTLDAGKACLAGIRRIMTLIQLISFILENLSYFLIQILVLFA